MASSLGYAMMNWTSEFARHAKAKRIKKKHSKNKENCDGKDQTQNTINLSDIKHKASKIGSLNENISCETHEMEIQTEGN